MFLVQSEDCHRLGDPVARWFLQAEAGVEEECSEKFTISQNLRIFFFSVLFILRLPGLVFSPS